MTDTSAVFLEGDIIFLRPLQESDIEGTYNNWLNDKEACEGNAHHTYPHTREDTLKYIRYALTTKTELILAIVDKKSNKHIGNIALHNITSIHRSAELSIFIGEKDFWGKGYAFEAWTLILEYAFLRLGLRKIIAGAIADNEGSVKVLKRLGFKVEGTFRQEVYVDGAYCDGIRFGLFREEFYKYGQ